MRSAIFMGLMYVGDKIGTTEISDEVARFLVVLFIVFVVMDVVDFVRGK